MKPVGQRLGEIADRFKRLVEPPVVEKLPEIPREPTPEERARAAFGAWIDDAPPSFWAELDKWVRAAHTYTRANIKDHGETAYSLGYEAAVEMVRDKFKSWRTTGSADPQEGD